MNHRRHLYRYRRIIYLVYIRIKLYNKYIKHKTFRRVAIIITLLF
jgi:hypothetical protein